MSRISYSEEEDFAGEFELWQANCLRSCSGKQGQASLRELEAALLALPSKRLIAEELDNGEDVCAVGALVRYKHLTLQSDPEEMEEVGMECGMPRLVAWKVVELNDIQLVGGLWDYSGPEPRFVPYTPEQRYTAVLKWVRERLNQKAA